MFKILTTALLLGLSQTLLVAQTNFNPVLINPFGITTIPVEGHPTLVDIDGDGDQDLFYDNPNGSTAASGLVYYPNTGTATAPSFGTAQFSPFGITLPLSLLPLRFSFVDIDNDGDQDLFMSTIDANGDGAIYYFPNTGSATAPAFGAAIASPFGLTVNTNDNYTTLSFADIDNDGDKDIFVGLFGQKDVLFFRNTGTATSASFAAAVTNPFSITPSAFGFNFDASFGDLDGDSDLDMFVNDNTGTFRYFQNTGTTTVPVFASPSNNPFGLTSVGTGFTNYAFLVDLDNDSDLDIVASSWSDSLFYFRNITPIIADVDFATSTVSINENAGTLSISIGLDKALANASTVDVVLVAGGSATNSSDFTFTSPTTINFPANSTAPQTLSIPIINDTDSEYFEYFTLQLNNPGTNVTIGTQDTIQVEINDDDFISSTISFTPSILTINEGGGSATVTVSISAAPPIPVTTNITLSGSSTASNGSDFTFSNTNITFTPNGVLTSTITIPITDDNNVEGNETIVLSLSSGNNQVATASTIPMTITIEDNDVAVPQVGFTGSVLTVGESTGTVSINLNITNANANPTTVDVVLKATSTANVGSDFNFTNPTTVTFPANTSGTQTITIPIINDSNIEPTEQIYLELSNPTNGANITSSNEYRINIQDDDTPPLLVSFDTSSVTVSEGVGSFTVDVTITNPNNRATEVDVLVDLQSTATFLDFVGGTSSFTQKLTFAANSTVKKTLTITVDDDTNIEGLETLVLDLKFPTNNAVLSPYPTIRINIVDNDGAATMSFSNATETRNEQAGGLFIEAVRGGSTSTFATATVTVTGGTATSGTDFSLASSVISFQPGFSTQVVFLDILDDFDTEGNETIVLTLTSNDATIAQGTSTITIIDDETVSINKIDNNTAKVFPIPADKQLFLELDKAPNNNEVTLQILNSIGQIVQQQTLDYSSSLAVNTSDLIEGIYYMVIRTEDEALPITKKFVVKH